MPSWAPDSTNESRSVTLRARWAALSPCSASLAQAAPVDGDVAELLGHEVAGHGRDHDDQQETDQDQHGGPGTREAGPSPAGYCRSSAKRYQRSLKCRCEMPDRGRPFGAPPACGSTSAHGQDLVIRTLSTAASTRLAVPVSAASTCSRTLWPAYADRLTVAVCHAAARLLAAPAWVKTRGGGRARDDPDAEVVGAGRVVEVRQVPGEGQRQRAGRQGDRGRPDGGGAAVDVVGAGAGARRSPR